MSGSGPAPERFVGRTYAADPVAVERWAAFCWARATRDPDDRFRYSRDGVQYAPPTFAQAIARQAAGTDGIEADLRGGDWSEPRVFLGGTRLAFDRPPVVGRTYAATAEVTDCERKSGSTGEFDLLTVEYRVEDDSGVAFRMGTDLVVRPPDGADGGDGGAESGDGGEHGGTESGDGGEYDGSRRRSTTPTPSATPTADDGTPEQRLPEGPLDPAALDPGTTVARRVVRDVSPADMRVVTAVVGDPNPLHFDPEYAAARGYPGRVNQGPVNAAYAGQAALAPAGSPAALEALSVRYEGFAFEGETVVAEATVDRVGDPGEGDGGDGGPGGPAGTGGGSRPVDLSLSAVASDGRRVVGGSATVVFPAGES
jgi:acyl dehydratase